MQLLERLAVVAKPASQPVEQLGMAGAISIETKIAGRVHDAATEVVMPNPVHDDAEKEAVASIGDPGGELGAAGGIRGRSTQSKIGFHPGHRAQATRRDLGAGTSNITAQEHIRRRGLLGNHRMNRHGFSVGASQGFAPMSDASQ